MSDISDSVATFSRLQYEVSAWSNDNFPGGACYHPLLGLAEEVGELSHAHLKMEQDIRVNEDHSSQQVDAVGDIVIFLADYCYRNGLDLGEAVNVAWNEVKQRNWQENKDDGGF